MSETATADVAVITGAASGLGRALAECCAQRGMHVAVLDLDGDRAATEAASLPNAHGIEALGLAGDVSQADSVEAAAATVSARFGRADLLVSNVGVQLFGAVERLTDDEWAWVLDVNVIGAARTARSFLPRAPPSIDRRGGRLRGDGGEQPRHDPRRRLPEDLAHRTIEQIVAGERDVITHGDLVDAVDDRSRDLRHAADAARAVPAPGG